jgi:molybdate transport system substrate-binding protein
MRPRRTVSPPDLIARFLILAILLIPSGCTALAGSDRSEPIIVSAAANLTPAFMELGQRFEAETDIPVTFNFGSSGKLTQQIEEGAPVDLFAAANVDYIDELAAQGLILPDTRALYAQGRLTLWTPADSELSLERIEDLTQLQVRQVAMANPAHAPYGVAAREALQNAGVWEAVQPKLIFGENIAQTLQLAETGGVDAALMALSLSLTSDGHWTLLPDHLYTPLDQELAVIAGAEHEDAARRFATFVNSPEARPIMRKYGFTLPGEELSP